MLIHLLVGLKFFICLINIFQLQIFQQNLYFSQSYCVLCVCVLGEHARSGTRSELMWSLAENRKAKAHALLTAKWTYMDISMAF